MHSFKSHTKAISSLVPAHTNENYIVTSSLDGTIKIWCLEKMIEIYSFEVWSSADGGLGGQMDKIELIDDRIYTIFLKGHSNAIEVG
jgi:WD40 repeat protein